MWVCFSMFQWHINLYVLFNYETTSVEGSNSTFKLIAMGINVAHTFPRVFDKN